MDLERYHRLLQNGTLSAYDDTKQGGGQIYAIACAALEGWAQEKARADQLAKFAQHLPGCVAGAPCTCGLERTHA